MVSGTAGTRIEQWPIDKLVFYARNPRKNDAVVDRMCGSIREFGFKIPVLARSDGEVVDGHLRLKAARKLNITEVPVILCDEWTPAQVKAFRLMVNRSVAWADWDEELLALELQELNAADFDLDLTGFNPKEIDDLLALPDEEKANEVPPVPENPVSRPGDLWICGKHRVRQGRRELHHLGLALAEVHHGRARSLNAAVPRYDSYPGTGAPILAAGRNKSCSIIDRCPAAFFPFVAVRRTVTEAYDLRLSGAARFRSSLELRRAAGAAGRRKE
jgi:ParB-like chromosome segregation protein Spo0J